MYIHRLTKHDVSQKSGHVRKRHLKFKLSRIITLPSRKLPFLAILTTNPIDVIKQRSRCHCLTFLIFPSSNSGT